jgi:hypothetical protein
VSDEDVRWGEIVGWWGGLVECRVCGHRHAAVCPISERSENPNNGECPRCRNMACDPVEET